MTLQAVCDRLNEEGIPTLRGGVLWRQLRFEPSSRRHRLPGKRASLKAVVEVDDLGAVSTNGRRSERSEEADVASTDDVFNLLNAVNGVTLKRMEVKSDAINQVTLKRLEDKGYLKSRDGETTQERAGRPKRYYAITAYGKKAMEYTRTTREELWKAIPKVAWELKSLIVSQ